MDLPTASLTPETAFMRAPDDFISENKHKIFVINVTIIIFTDKASHLCLVTAYSWVSSGKSSLKKNNLAIFMSLPNTMD